MINLFYPVVLPIAAGILCLLIPEKLKGAIKVIALLVSIATFVFTIWLFNVNEAGDFFLKDGLSSLILIAIGLFGLLTVVYSLNYISEKHGEKEYYCYILLTLGSACGAALANNLILVLIFWGFLGFTLYRLVGTGGADAAPAAKKTLVIVGGTDALMVMGIAIIWFLTKSDITNFITNLKMSEITKSRIVLAGVLPVVAYVFLAIGCLAKAGAMPLHTWVPDASEKSPAPVAAFLPASLDKLLGIYLLARTSLYLFDLSQAAAMQTILLALGAITIMAAVMMALVQHDLKRLLGYHAVSQVGYMILGIGTLNIAGTAGALFHMLNNSIYKQGLFLAGGAVEHRTGTSDLGKLGGLAKFMPITFLTCFIAALSISGVPPFNGFFSKWMIYQGIIELGKNGGHLWIIWLVAAMFGSALTLASFSKLIHATFLGQKSSTTEPKVKEVGISMWLPMAVLALLCIVFGVFAYALPMKHLILPGVEELLPGSTKAEWMTGFWQPSLATLMLLGGIVLGLVLYLLGNLKGFREDDAYIGGEILPEENRLTGVNFYKGIKDIPGFHEIYEKAENKVFDIYEQGKKLTFCINNKLSDAHTGILPTYLVWCLLGMLILFFVLLT